MSANRSFPYTYYGEIHEINVELSIQELDSDKQVSIDIKLNEHREKTTQFFKVDYLKSGTTNTSHFRSALEFNNVKDKTQSLNENESLMNSIKMSQIFAEFVQELLFVKTDYIFLEQNDKLSEEELLSAVLNDFYSV